MPSDHDVVRCGLCGARIRWTVTASGAAQSVNADPDPSGNTAVFTDGTGRVRSRGISKERPTLEHAEWLARPHIADCARPLGAPTRQTHPRTGVRRQPRRPR
ncbi:hypothetical protein P3L51_35775 [Streptomyces sp. PSRA5]|uniref:hypothetical protein n=1 Tax=Streptomyces panacea TaxID=3035064 RepID=UPI00339BC06D